MKKTILLADDDPAVRRMLCRVLDGENYRVLPASDGQEALAACHTGGVDLVLLDLSQPAETDWRTFRRLSSEHPSLPVILIAGQPEQPIPHRPKGLAAWLEKPLDLPKLLRTIAHLLDRPGQPATGSA
jgi:CheY-like chemotaxis protein